MRTVESDSRQNLLIYNYIYISVCHVKKTVNYGLSVRSYPRYDFHIYFSLNYHSCMQSVITKTPRGILYATYLKGELHVQLDKKN